MTYAQDGASRAHIERMFEQLGIAAEMRAKALLEQGSVRAAARVVAGEAEILLTLVSEILPVDGIELLGPLPAEFQSYISFAASRHAAEGSGPRVTFIACVAAPAAAPTFAAQGIEQRDRAMKCIRYTLAAASLRVGRARTPLDGARLPPRRRAHRSGRRHHGGRVGQPARALQDARRGRGRRRARLGDRVELRQHREPLRPDGRARRGRNARQGCRQRRPAGRQRPLAHEHAAAERREILFGAARSAALVAADDRLRHPRRRDRGYAEASASSACGRTRRARRRSGATTCR